MDRWLKLPLKWKKRYYIHVLQLSFLCCEATTACPKVSDTDFI